MAECHKAVAPSVGPKGIVADPPCRLTLLMSRQRGEFVDENRLELKVTIWVLCVPAMFYM